MCLQLNMPTNSELYEHWVPDPLRFLSAMSWVVLSWKLVFAYECSIISINWGLLTCSSTSLGFISVRKGSVLKFTTGPR